MAYLRRFWPLLTLILIPCILLAPIFTGRVMVPANLLADVAPWRATNPSNLAPWNPLQFDGITQFYPWRSFYAETVKSGFLPLWNPYQFCGTPFLANGQSAVLYPLSVLFVIFPVATAFGVSALLHLVLTGSFFYLFLRRSVGVSRAAALFGASVWQLSSWQVSWLALPSFLDTATWIPLTLLLIDRAIVAPSFRRAGALGATFGLMLLAGHLQIALYGILLAIGYAVFRVASTKTRTNAALRIALATAIVAFGIAAPQLLPTLELSRVSHRAAEKATAAGYEGYRSLAMPPYMLVTLYLPDFFGRPQDRGNTSPLPTDPPGQATYHGENAYWGATNYAENACYVGVIAFALAIAGITCGWKSSGTVRFLAIAALVAMLIAVGSPLDALLYYGIPGFSHTGSPARVLVVWALSIAALSAVGLDALLVKEASVIKSVGFYVVLGLVIIAASVEYLTRLTGSVENVTSALPNLIRVFAALFVGALGISAMYFRKLIAMPVCAALLIAVSTADLLYATNGYNAFVSPFQVYPVTPGIAWLQANAGNAHILPLNASWSLYRAPLAVLPPNSATMFHLRDIQGYDSLQTAQYKAFANHLNGGRESSPRENGNMIFVSQPSPLRLAKYYMTAVPLPNAPTPAYSGTDCTIYADPSAQSFATDALGAVLVAHEEAPTRIQVETGGGSDIKLLNQWYPGWSASEGGRNLLVAEAEGVFTSVSGSTPGTVAVIYEPSAFRVGLYLASITLCVLSAAATTRLQRHRQLA